MTRRALLAATVITGALTLFGCSAPPAPGNWLATDGGEQNFSRLKIEFDGKAEIFIPSQEAALLRCFWRASGPQSILLQCAYADKTKNEEFYDFTVTENDLGTLSQGSSVRARFRRAPR